MHSDDLQPTKGTPELPPGFEGVALALAMPHAPRGPLDVLGAFQLPSEQADAIDRHPHRGLVLVIAGRAGCLVASTFRERIFFDEDVQRPGALVRGYFRLRLVEPTSDLPAGEHWISVSLGEHVSNVVAFAGVPPAGQS